MYQIPVKPGHFRESRGHPVFYRTELPHEHSLKSNVALKPELFEPMLQITAGKQSLDIQMSRPAIKNPNKAWPAFQDPGKA